MARITLDSIIEDIAQDNWKVISTEYKNLDTEMEFECAEGHKVFAPYKQIRTKRECPICKANKFKNVTEIKPKKKGIYRTLALDQASHLTGYAIYDGRELTTYGVYNAPGADEITRLHNVNMWLISQIQQWQPDMIGLEGIQYEAHITNAITTFQTLARLQGILMETCTQASIPFRLCHPSTWRGHCGVKGRTRQDKKRSMQLLVKQWFDISVSDDCADAIGIGKYVSDNFVKQTEIINWE